MAGVDRAAHTTGTQLHFASALDAAHAICTRQVSSVELTGQVLQRIDAINPKLNAYVTLISGEAMERARHADDALARGEWWGPLHGVPCSVKDTFETAGVRTTAGAIPDHIPDEDAAAVARLKSAGAIILGKTNVPPMAADWQSYNEIFGTANNPWDLARTPGGSSGGEAAAVAAGLSFLGIGSDIGGSIRIPAHFCGVYGHKPTLGVVPLRGHIPPPPGMPQRPLAMSVGDLPVAGPLARSASDLKIALEILGGPDSHDAAAYRWSLPQPRRSRLADYRIGYVLDDPLCPVSSPVKSVLGNAVDALRQAGAKLDEGWPAGLDPAQQIETYRYMIFAVMALFMRPEDVQQARASAASGDPVGKAMEMAITAPHSVFYQANSRRCASLALWQEYFRTHDAFLLPAAYTPAFAHDHRAPMEIRTIATPEGERSYMDLLFWMTPATLNGLPATVAPAGLTPDRLPVGLQILGPYLEDATPIDLAGRLADLIGGFQPPRGY
ncbi:MAG: amidase [Terriglobales bacterium]